MAHTVYEKSRRAVHTAADPTHEILTQAGQMRMLGNGAKELSGGKAERTSVLGEMPVIERGLVPVKSVMHLPKFSVGPRFLSSLRRVFGMGMHLSERKMAKDKSQFVAKLPSNFLDDRVSRATVRAFIVAVLQQGHGCCRRAADMITLAYR